MNEKQLISTLNKQTKITNIKKFSVLLLLFTLFSCGQTLDYDEKKEYFKEEKSILYYEGSPYTGVLVTYYNTDKTLLEYKKTYKDGKLDGQYKGYDVNGQLYVKSTYKDGKRDGPYEGYVDGQLYVKGTYKDGKLDGPYEQYYENGQLNVKSTYKYGKRDGSYEQYNVNGQLIGKGTFKDDKFKSKSTLEDGKEVQSKDVRDMTIEESMFFMKKTTKEIGQQVIKSFETSFNGQKVYMFFTLSLSNPGLSCISIMTPNSTEILNSDCGSNQRKVEEWNSIPGSPKIYL